MTHSCFLGGSFDPETAALLAAALDAAWDTVVKSGSSLPSTEGAAVIRERLAKRIIETATAGERDKVRLVEDALTHLTRTG
jgi:hypothetical protein